MNTILRSICFLFSFIVFQSSYAQVTVVSGGAGLASSYTSLTNASGLFADLNSINQSGQTVVISITADVTETGANALTGAAGMWSSLQITPVGARTLSGSLAGHLFDLNGADNVTIDGLNTSGNTLTLVNLSTSSSASTIRFFNDATGNVITNCNLQGSSGASISGLGTLFFSTGITTGNINNTISNNNIGPAGSNLPLNAIFSLGTSLAIPNTVNVTNNNIFDYFNGGLASAGINCNSNNTGWTISGNSFYQTSARTSTASNFHYGIFITNTGVGYTISGNYIGGKAPLCGGTAWQLLGAFTNRFVGIAVNAGAAATTSIQGNTIANFSTNTNSSATTANGNFSGIWVSGGNANIGTVAGNTIGSGTGTGSIAVNLQTNSGGTANLISYSGVGAVAIRNNIIGSVTLTATTSISQGCHAIFVSSGSPTIANNTIGSTVTPNSIHSSTVSSSAIAQQMTGINLTSGISTASNITVSGNVIANMTQAGTGTTHFIRGITFAGQGSTSTITLNITDNTIRNLTGANANATLASVGLGVMGIQVLVNTASTFYASPVISGNTIFALSATNATAVQTNVCGIGASNCSNGSITKNIIYDLRSASTMATVTTPPTVSGVLVRAVVIGQITVANNMISLGNAQTTNTEFLGIWCAFSSANTNVYHNTVNIQGTVTAGALPSFTFLRGDNAAASAITSTVDIKNNIFNNARSGGTGNHYAIGNNYGNAVSSVVGWTSNYNALNSAGASTIGYWSTAVSFTNWKIASASDANSISGVPVPFFDAANGDLHLNMGVSPTLIESRGILIPSTMDDIDMQTRPGPAGSVNGGASAPDLGADEFDGTPVDDIGPTITYTGFVNTLSLMDRTLTPVTITDLSGVNTTVGTKPRMYFKKSSDANTYAGNTSADNGWKYVEATNASSPFDFTTDYALLQSAPVAGDQIQYFVVAQDLLSNVGINNGIFTATPSSVALTSAAFPLTGAINAYFVSNTLSGTKTVCTTGCDYPTITGVNGLFASLNAAVLTGNVVAVVQSDLTEDGTNVLNAWVESGIGNYTLAITPDAAVVRTISGAVVAGLIRINGADRVTFDGSFGGSGRFLTFRNTDASFTSGSAISFSNGSNDFLVRNCTIEAGTNGSFGTVTIGTGGNSNGAIQGNKISGSVGLTIGVQAIYSGGSLGNENQNITVANNELVNAQRGISIPAFGSMLWTITGNSFYLDGISLNTASAFTVNGILISGGAGYTVQNNFIGGTAPNAGGGNAVFTSTAASAQVNGISVTPSTASPITSVKGNTVAAITINTVPTAANTFTFQGLALSGAAVNVGGALPGEGNTIGSPSANSSIIITTTTTATANTSIVRGISNFSTGGYVTGNQVGGIDVNNLGAAPAGTSIQGILVNPTSATPPSSIDGNLVGSTTVANSIRVLPSAIATTGSSIDAILTSTGITGPLNILNNTVQNISQLSTTASGSVNGIRNAATAATAVININNNLVRDITSGVNASNNGIFYSGITTSSPGSVNQNVIRNISFQGTGTGCTLIGISNSSATNGGTTMQMDSIFNLSSTSTKTILETGNPANGTLAGMVYSGAGTGAVLDKNVIFNLASTTSTATNTGVTGIGVTNGSSTGVITKNQVFDLSNTATGTTTKPFIKGIYAFWGAAFSASNNMIALSNGANTNDLIIDGISDFAGTPSAWTYYHNTVSISGIGSAGTARTACFQRLADTDITLKSNLFSNTRVAGSNNFAVSNTDVAPGTGWLSTSSDYNDFFCTNAANIGEWGIGVPRTLAQWQGASGGDVNSISVLPVFATAIDLHLTSANSALNNLGTPIAGITVDIDNDTRNATTPDLGADEFEPTTVLTLTNTFIEGYMDGASMRPVLLNAYNAGWVAPIPGAPATAPSSALCDSIIVELHNATSPYALAYAQTVVLGVTGAVTVNFPGATNGNSYYVVVKGRNILETWSNSTVTFTAGLASNSFATAFGSNLGLVGGIPVIYSGDIDHDEEILPGDYNIWLLSNAAGDVGYFPSDLDGDGEVLPADYSIWLVNNAAGVLVVKP